MKKIITLFALTVSLFLTSESLSAQNSQLNQAEIEDKAKKEMISLDEELDLTTEQKQFVFKHYYSYFTNYNKHLNQKIKDADYKKKLDSVEPLNNLIKKYHPEISEKDSYFLKEFLLWALVEFKKLSKHRFAKGVQFKDLYGSYISDL